jgi:hypothetical protein
MPFSGTWPSVGLLRTDVSEKRFAFMPRAKRISGLGRALAVTSRADVAPSSLILSTLKMEATRPSQTSVLTRPTRHHIPEGGHKPVGTSLPSHIWQSGLGRRGSTAHISVKSGAAVPLTYFGRRTSRVGATLPLTALRAVPSPAVPCRADPYVRGSPHSALLSNHDRNCARQWATHNFPNSVYSILHTSLALILIYCRVTPTAGK